MIKIEAYQCEYCTKHRKGTGKPIRIYRRSIDTQEGCIYCGHKELRKMETLEPEEGEEQK